MRTASFALGLMVAGLTACGQASDKAAELMVEKMIEKEASKDGTKAQVDLSGNTAKITTTDASGKTSQVEFGGAKVTEAELGLPFYPGAQVTQDGSTKVVTPEGTMFTVGLTSDDKVEKVAGFYRDKLKAQSAGKEFMDMSGGDGGTMLMLGDDKNKHSMQVHVTNTDPGSSVQIVVTRAKAQ